MTRREIQQIKKSGSESAIRQTIDSKLWAARKRLEEATHDHARQFSSKLEDVEAILRDLRELYRELPDPPKRSTPPPDGEPT